MNGRGIARLDDETDGYCTRCEEIRKGKITTASEDFFVEKDGEAKGVARIGDEVTAVCGHKGTIKTGSQKMLLSKDGEAKGVARIEDETEGIYLAKIITASDKVFVEFFE